MGRHRTNDNRAATPHWKSARERAGRIKIGMMMLIAQGVGATQTLLSPPAPAPILIASKKRYASR